MGIHKRKSKPFQSDVAKRKSAVAAIEEIRRMSRKIKLGKKIRLKELIEEGRA